LPTPTYDAYLPTVLIANVRSLASKIDELTIVAHVHDVDFICLTESWLSQSIYSKLNPYGYLWDQDICPGQFPSHS
jgi:hypothetical protein